MDELPSCPTVTALADAVHARRVTCRDLTEQALARIAERDVAVGAFQIVRNRQALVEADALDARSNLGDLPLAGVPVAVKDNVPVAGEPMRAGSEASDPTPQSTDHPVVARLRAAGAVVVGLTRLPELGVYGMTDSTFGITRNPWDLSRTAGGSSGGSAAAVAAGMVPAAHGNDGLGSIRIPAACCGLVGMKPGADVVPSQIGNGSWFGLSENGPLATTVTDSALLLSVMAESPALAEAPFRSPSSLRIAVASRPPIPATPVHDAFVRAAQRTSDVLRQAGHTAVARELPRPVVAQLAGVARWFAGAEMDARRMQDRTRLTKPVSRHATVGRIVISAGLVKESHRKVWQDAAARFFDGVDVLLTPALAQVPPLALRWSERGCLANLRASAGYAPYCGPWNLAGWPAIVIPAGRELVDGLPLAVQLVAPPGGEALLLALAAQVEQLAPWQRVAPAYSF